MREGGGGGGGVYHCNKYLFHSVFIKNIKSCQIPEVLSGWGLGGGLGGLAASFMAQHSSALDPPETYML